MAKKKKGVNQRARKRANAAAESLTAAAASSTSTRRVESKSDSDLFVLDSTGEDRAAALAHVPKKQRLSSSSKEDGDGGKKGRKDRLSEKDERQVRRLIEAHGTDGAVVLARESRERLARRKRSKRLAGGARTNFDLWGDGDAGADKAAAVAKGKTQKKKVLAVASGVTSMAGTAPVEIIESTKKASDAPPAEPEVSNKLRKAREAHRLSAPPTVPVEVAHAGQSYRPDPEAHQDMIGEALAIELRRNEAIEYRETPVAQGLSEETRAVLVGSDDESGSDEDDDEEDGGGGGGEAGDAFRPHKKREKLTRAQRNRRRRAKAERVALEKRRAEKRLLSAAADVKKFAKDVAKEEAIHAERRAELRRLRAEAAASKPLGMDVLGKLSKIDPINAPSVPVALTSELLDPGHGGGAGTLRTVRPKGSLLTDRMESLADRKMANRKTLVKKNIVQGKKRKMKGGKGREYLLI